MFEHEGERLLGSVVRIPAASRGVNRPTLLTPPLLSYGEARLPVSVEGVGHGRHLGSRRGTPDQGIHPNQRFFSDAAVNSACSLDGTDESRVPFFSRIADPVAPVREARLSQWGPATVGSLSPRSSETRTARGPQSSPHRPILAEHRQIAAYLLFDKAAI